MFSDPQFWVAVSFILFIAAIFNPVRKILTSSLDAQIKDIKNKIDEVENLKNEAQKALDELNAFLNCPNISCSPTTWESIPQQTLHICSKAFKLS